MNKKTDQQIAWRVLDANTNRSLEAIRTLEEIVRFGFNDITLTKDLKSIRHRIANSIQQVDPESKRVVARETESDVGTRVSTQSELQRENLLSIAECATGRLQESLRCIEEFAKLTASEFENEFESIRYSVYSINQKILARFKRDTASLSTRIQVLVDCQLSLSDFVQRIQMLASAGVRLIQLRDKSVSDRMLLKYAAATKSIDRVKLIINDRVDIALACNADGVHLGQDDLPLELARSMVGSDMWIGVSTHDLAQVRIAIEQGADYVGCGPTFQSQTKQFDDFAGLDFLRSAANLLSGQIPAFAIGGISGSNIGEVVQTGFRQVAVSHSVWQSNEPAKVVTELINSISPDLPG